MSKLHYITWAEAEELKALAVRVFNDSSDPKIPPSERDLVVTAENLLSLIEQSRSPMLGLATTKELREELACRLKHPDSSHDNYRTFVPSETVSGDSNAHR